MSKQRNSNIIYILFLLFCLNSFAWSNDFAENDDYNYDSVEEDESVFKFAWDLPYYGDTYDFAKRFTRFELNSAGQLYVGYEMGRNEEGEDEFAFFTFAAFRPFVLDFGPEFQVAFGVSYIGYIGTVDVNENFIDGSFIIEDVGTVNGAVQTSDTDRDSELNSFNFTALLNFPTLALQVHFQIGYARTMVRVEMDRLDLDGNIRVLDIFDVRLKGAFEDFEFVQRDDNIFLNLAVRKFYDRDYLNFISFSVSSRIQVDTDERKSTATPVLEIFGDDVNINFGKTNLADIGLDPQPFDADLNKVQGTLSADLYSFQLPFSVLGNDRINLGGIFAMNHRSGELLGRDLHGHALIAGAKLEFFGALGVIFEQTWENGNDQDDGWVLTFVLGLYGSRGNTGIITETQGISTGTPSAQ